jgi:tRNA G18 (ribose-2'-O)-methylase SpoU
LPAAADLPPGGLWAVLGDADALRARGLFVAEGRRVIQAILDGAAGGAPAIVAALATPQAAEALDLASRLGERLDVRPPNAVQALTGFNFHRGALAIVRRPPPLSVASLIGGSDAPACPPKPGRRRVVDSDPSARSAFDGCSGRPEQRRGTGSAPYRQTQSPLYVVGEQIADADNVGSLFRNARAFGASAVLLDDRSADPLYRKAVRTSLGAVLHVPWSCDPLPDILGALARRGVVTVGLTPGPEVPTLAEVLSDTAAGAGRGIPLALLVGNEGAGLSGAARAACDRLACIPMSPGADSLNVATALAVALYEARRLR